MTWYKFPEREIDRAYRTNPDLGAMLLGYNAALPKIRRQERRRNQTQEAAQQPKPKDKS
jgi:hypothetical protein